MITNIDRVQLVVGDRAGTADSWGRLLGTEVVREDAVKPLGAKRTVLAMGTAEVELLEPDGSGPVTAFMEETGRGGLFAAGLATDDIDAIRARLSDRGAKFSEESGQLFLEPGAVEGAGFRAVITPAAQRKRAGVMNRLHEVSFLVPEPPTSARSLVETFDLGEQFGEAQSDAFGFQGVHVFLTPARTDDIETIHPVDGDKAMGRFFARRGSSLYMCFGESDDMERVRALAAEHAGSDWTGPREGPADASSIFLHPKVLGGVMLGIRKATAGGGH